MSTARTFVTEKGMSITYIEHVPYPLLTGYARMKNRQTIVMCDRRRICVEHDADHDTIDVKKIVAVNGEPSYEWVKASDLPNSEMMQLFALCTEFNFIEVKLIKPAGE